MGSQSVHDRSMEPLKKAAALSDDGNLYLRLGQVFMAREDWSNAAKYFKQAVAKSGLKAPGSADLLLGIVYYNEDETAEALKWFRRAKKHETTRKTANDWMDHIAKETQSSASHAARQSVRTQGGEAALRRRCLVQRQGRQRPCISGSGYV